MDKVKGFLLAHFEKLVLVVAVLFLGLSLHSMFSRSEVDLLEDENKKKVKILEESIGSSKADDAELPPFIEVFREYQNNVHPASAAYFWAGAVRPDQPPATPNDVQVDGEVVITNIFDAVDFSITVQMGMAQLRWADNPKNKRICEGYNIYRRKRGAKEWSQPLNGAPVEPWVDLAQFDESEEERENIQGGLAAKFNKATVRVASDEKMANETSPYRKHHRYRYEDSTVHPNTKYEYKVVAIIKRGGLDSADRLAEKFPVASVSIPRSVKVFYIGGSPMGVTIEIVKFETVEDALGDGRATYVVNKSFFTKKGSQIGVDSMGRSTKKVKVGGEVGKVDFASGYTLLDIVNKKEFVDEERVKIVADPLTGKEVQVKQVVKIEKKLDYILVRDDETKDEIKKHKIKRSEFKKILSELKAEGGR